MRKANCHKIEHAGMLFWQQRELTAEKASRHRHKYHLSLYTHLCTNTHMENPNICICQYFLNRIYHFAKFQSWWRLKNTKIFCAGSILPLILLAHFFLSMLDHTALRQYQKWYANCKNFCKLLHIYSLTYKDFISWIIAFYQLYFMALAVLFLFC